MISQSEANPFAAHARHQAVWLWITKILLAAIPVFGLIFAFNLTFYLGYPMWVEQAALLVLGAGLGAAFLHKPGGSERAGPADGTSGPTALDKGLALLAIGLCITTAIRYEGLVAIGYLGTGAAYYVNLTIAFTSLVLILEVVRRLTGWVMVILVTTLLAYAAFAHHLPGDLRGHQNDLDFLLGYLYLDNSGVLGTPLAVVVSTVIAYVLLGSALFRLGGGQMFLDLALSSMGGYRGGPAKASVIASSMFGSISGSAVANVATTGIVTVPLMVRTGYRREDAGAIEAVASTGGQLLPPIMGAAAFIMAEFLGVPYTEVALAALVPALLFYVALLAQIHFHARRRGLRILTPAERPNARRALRKYWAFLVPLAALVVLLFVLRWRPEKAAFASLPLVVLAAAWVREHSIGPRALFETLQGAGQSLLAIIAITAAAGIVVGVLSVTGLGFSLGLGLAEAAGTNMFLLLIIAAVACLAFGMGMPTTAVYILMATLVVPPLTALGVEPISAHLFVLYFGVLSMITPPVCLASFTAASVANGSFMRTGIASVRFGSVAFIVPFLFVAAPALLLQAGNDWLLAARTTLTAMVGCVLFAAAVEGYFTRTLGWRARSLIAGTAVLLILPDNGVLVPLPGVPTDAIGMVLLPVVLACIWWGGHRERSLVAAEHCVANELKET